jgi:hypothetical protein
MTAIDREFADGEYTQQVIVTTARITCPHCQATIVEVMPVTSSLRVYECQDCGAILTPKAGDCCVFCSYADRPCPTIQAERQATEDKR